MYPLIYHWSKLFIEIINCNKQLFDKNTGLNPDFSFNEMVIEICQLLGDGKGVAAFIIKNFYQRKTNPKSKTI